MAFAPLDLLGRIVTPRPAALGRLDRLTVDHPRRRARVAARRFARLQQQVKIDVLKQAAVSPVVEVALHRRERRKVLGQHPPLTAGPRDGQDCIEHAAQFGRARPAQTLSRRHVRLNQRPFGVGQVACVALSLSHILSASDFGPHLVLDDCFATTIMSQLAEITQFIFGRPLRYPQPYRYLAACYAHMGRLDGRTSDDRAAAGHHLCRDTGPQLPAEHRASRAVSFRSAAGGRRSDMSQTRRLAADVAGYSRLMEADEEGTLERLKALRRELFDPKIAAHHGRIVKTTGDGMLVEFASVVDAVRCAVEAQQAMPERNTGVGADNRIDLRIGINLCDVIVEGDYLYSDGVNIAGRIEDLADPDGVFVSNTVHDHVRDRLPFLFEDLGEQQVKNITRPVRVYRVRPEGPLPSPPPVYGPGR